MKIDANLPLRHDISRILERAKALREVKDLTFTAELRMGSRRRIADSLVDDVLPLAIEASRRAHSLEHYPVQVLGGIELVNNRIIAQNRDTQY